MQGGGQTKGTQRRRVIVLLYATNVGSLKYLEHRGDEYLHVPTSWVFQFLKCAEVKDLYASEDSEFFFNNYSSIQR